MARMPTTPQPSGGWRWGDVWHNSSVPYPATRGPGRPPAAKAAETRERIVRAARQVFSELGYDAATFQEIAVRADLTRPAINHYFRNKRVLYQEVVERTNELIVAHSAQKASQAETLLDQLDAFIEGAVGADRDDPSAAAFLVTSVMEAQRHPELRHEQQDALLVTRKFVASA